MCLNEKGSNGNLHVYKQNIQHFCHEMFYDNIFEIDTHMGKSLYTRNIIHNLCRSIELLSLNREKAGS